MNKMLWLYGNINLTFFCFRLNIRRKIFLVPYFLHFIPMHELVLISNSIRLHIIIILLHSIILCFATVLLLHDNFDDFSTLTKIIKKTF